MSILDKEVDYQNYAVVVASDILNVYKQLYNNMIEQYRHGTLLYWRNSKATPQEIADAFGTDAGEIFQNHYALGQLLTTINPEEVAQINELVGNFTINEDGTVTITE